jgi:hypothetical protein
MKIGSEEQRSGGQLLRECFVNGMSSKQDAADEARYDCDRRSTLALIAGQAFALDLLQPAFCRGSSRLAWCGCALELARAVPANSA